VSSLGLDDRIHIRAGTESRPEAYHDAAIRAPGSRVALCHDGVHYHDGRHPREDASVRVNEHRHAAALHHGAPSLAVRSLRAHPFHGMAAQVDRLREGDRKAYRGGLGQLGQDDCEPGPVKGKCNSRCKVPAAFDKRQGRSPPRLRPGELTRLWSRTPPPAGGKAGCPGSPAWSKGSAARRCRLPACPQDPPGSKGRDTPSPA